MYRCIHGSPMGILKDLAYLIISFFKSDNIITPARVYLMKTENVCKDVAS